MEELTVKIRSYEQNEFIVSYRMLGSITPFVICSCFLMEYSGIIFDRMISKDSSDNKFKGTEPTPIVSNAILSRNEEYKLEIARSSLGSIALNSKYPSRNPFNRGTDEFLKSPNVFKILQVGLLSKELLTRYGIFFDCKYFTCLFIGRQNQTVINENSTFIYFINNKLDEFIVGQLATLKSNHQVTHGIKKKSIIRRVKKVNYENKRKPLQNKVLNYRQSVNLNLKEILLDTKKLKNRNYVIAKREMFEGTDHSTEVMFKKNDNILKCNETDTQQYNIHFSSENIHQYNADETRNLKNITFIVTTEQTMYNSQMSGKMLTNASSNYKEDEMAALPTLTFNRRQSRLQFRNEKPNSSSVKGLKVNEKNSRAFQTIVKVKRNNTRMKNHFNNGGHFRSVNKHKENSARIDNGIVSSTEYEVKGNKIIVENANRSGTANSVKRNGTRIDNGIVSRTTYKVRPNNAKKSRLNIKFKDSETNMENEKGLNTYNKVKRNYTRIKSGKIFGNNLVGGSLIDSVNLKSGLKKRRKNQIKGNKGTSVYKRKYNTLVFRTESYLKNYEEKTGRNLTNIYNTTTEQASLNSVSESNIKLYQNVGEMNKTLTYRVTSDRRRKYSHKGSKNENLYDIKLEDNLKSKRNKNRTIKHSMNKRKKIGSYNLKKLKSEGKQIKGNLWKPLAGNAEVFGDLKSSNLSEIAANDTLRAKQLNQTGENLMNQTQLINFLQFLTKQHNIISTSQPIEPTSILSDFDTTPTLGSTTTLLLNNLSVVNKDLQEKDNKSQVENEIERTDKEKPENVIETNITGHRANSSKKKASPYGSDDKSTSDESSNRSAQYHYNENNSWKIIIIPVVATVLGTLVVIGTVFLCWRCCCEPILGNAPSRSICHCQACSSPRPYCSRGFFVNN